MKVKTAELNGLALDWVVAKIEKAHRVHLLPEDFADYRNEGRYNFSENWAKGGPIIEREKIASDYFPDGGHKDGGMWMAVNTREVEGGIEQIGGEGKTLLIAAMRCYVALVLGDEVDVPEGLK